MDYFNEKTWETWANDNYSEFESLKDGAKIAIMLPNTDNLIILEKGSEISVKIDDRYSFEFPFAEIGFKFKENAVDEVLNDKTLKTLQRLTSNDEIGIMANAVNFSDTAIIVISRTSRETADLPADVLRLSAEEKNLVEKVTSSFENVIVLFNTGNVMEMGWLEEYDSIKAAAMIWIPGEFGMRAVAQMLTGAVNPSGRLTDTVAYSVEDHPSTECFGTYEYEGGGYYVEYLEGIYVGYRYFETFAKDKVQYPFGYGISYTTFEKELVSYDIGEDVITAEVKVTNTGDVAGKETVQIYYSAPYTDGGIEKSAICLGGYGKTQMLQPNESEIVNIVP